MINWRDMLTEKLIITPPLILKYLCICKQRTLLTEYYLIFYAYWWEHM